MDVAPLYDDLLDHLARTTDLGRSQSARFVAEVLAYFAETTEGFVRRRHTELLQSGASNPEIFPRIHAELVAWRVRPPELSERQLRRIVYG